MKRKEMGSVQKIKVVQSIEKPVAAEIIAQSIVDIAHGMRQLNATRLTQRALVTLIHEHSKVPKSHISVVLNNLESLEQVWLKKI